MFGSDLGCLCEACRVDQWPLTKCTQLKECGQWKRKNLTQIPMAADGVFPEHDPDQAEAEEGGEGRASFD